MSCPKKLGLLPRSEKRPNALSRWQGLSCETFRKASEEAVRQERREGKVDKATQGHRPEKRNLSSGAPIDGDFTVAFEHVDIFAVKVAVFLPV